MTSALYPYVHILAWGISDTRYSSGQKTFGVAGDVSSPVSVGLVLAFRNPKNDLMSLRRRAVSSSSLVILSEAPSQVSRGCPLRPWTNTMLRRVLEEKPQRMCVSGVIL